MNVLYFGFGSGQAMFLLFSPNHSLGKVINICVSLIDYQNLQFNYLADNLFERNNDEMCR